MPSLASATTKQHKNEMKIPIMNSISLLASNFNLGWKKRIMEEVKGKFYGEPVICRV